MAFTPLKDPLESKSFEALPRLGQALLVGVILLVVAMLMLPLSPVLLDILLVLNIVAALTILISAVSVQDPIRLSSFTTLLLACTLFRLGLNVSSTRLILTRGEAGDLINTFGLYVTGGNTAVGLVMFLVLLVIQFLVVSKGSERVAEVAARFTLDGLPGKQMSIDADLRAGAITNDQAKAQRGALIVESKFYGALDGAMKFVKGDAIAGFIIVFINLLGGMVIGVLQRGLEVGQAVRTYSALSIGEGLLAIMPSLLISLAAGFLVTRVPDADGDKSAGAQIGEQLFARPQTFYTVAGVTLVLGFVPGLPLLLFVIIAAFLAVFGFFLQSRGKRSRADTTAVQRFLVDSAGRPDALGHALPLLLELGKDMYAKFLRDDRWRACLNVLYPEQKTRLSNELGIPLPDVKITVNAKLPPDKYRVKIYEIPVEEGFLSPEHCVIRNYAKTPVNLALAGGERTTETVHGTPVMLVQLDRQDEMERQGIKLLQPEEMLLSHLMKVLRRNAEEFVGIQEVRDILSNVEKHHPELVREVIPRALTIHKLTDVIKRLVGEGIPVKDFRLILEVLSGSQADSKSPVELTELVRMGLKRVISYLYTGGTNRLTCFRLDEEIERDIEAHIRKSGEDTYLALPPERIDRICAAVRATYRNHALTYVEAVLLTDSSVRRFVRKLLETDLPEVSVLSAQELDPRVAIDARDTIGLTAPDVFSVN